ncbi:MAG: hypothetical protein R2794_13180 [Chitinophagales bacterium]
MRIFFVCLTLVFFTACNHAVQAPEAYSEIVLSPTVHVVYSESLYKGDYNMSSNIFVIRGTGDTVWIFNMGYGDGGENCDASCNDYTYYKGKGFSTRRNAIDDAREVEKIITGAFAMQKDSVIIECIVPHFHADHVNAEFIEALFQTIGFPLTPANRIYVHRNDSLGAVCNSPCCGQEPCGPNKKNPFYAAPYDKPWSSAFLPMFSGIGHANDKCGTEIMGFTSADGMWRVVKGQAVADGGHTDGTINLENAQLKLRIDGTNNKPQCPLPGGWTSVSVHGVVK